MGGGARWAAIHEVAKSWTSLSDFTFTFHFHALEKEVATHSSVLAWRIPGIREPGGLPPTGSHRVGHDWSDLAAAFQVSLSPLQNHTYSHSHLTVLSGWQLRISVVLHLCITEDTISIPVMEQKLTLLNLLILRGDLGYAKSCAFT